ncbi:hypothetical protein [Saccharomonospora iraqiensis]|uniref:hypothetical protein n=1 Tax=Saccharomonospora iraqiensis TaxID=52698 RepID=UPI00022E60F2|nr:hypothetical protein [Saccharomonospora iraqiensis]
MASTRLAAAAVLTVAVAVSACAKDTDAGDPPAPPPSAASQSPQEPAGADVPPHNERGHLVKDLGAEAGIGRGEEAATFVLDRVEVSPGCEEPYVDGPDSGTVLRLHLRVATGSDPEIARALNGLLNPFNFAELGSDGVTHPAEPGTCYSETERPRSFGTNQQYRMTLDVVVPEASGTLILATSWLEYGNGWEWTY